MIDTTTPLGPNVKRLTIERAVQLQIDAAKEQFGAAGVGEVAASIAHGEAFEWVRDALAAARRAPGSEHWPTDEDMAGEILRRIADRRTSA